MQLSDRGSDLCADVAAYYGGRAGLERVGAILVGVLRDGCVDDFLGGLSGDAARALVGNALLGISVAREVCDAQASGSAPDAGGER